MLLLGDDKTQHMSGMETKYSKLKQNCGTLSSILINGTAPS